MKLWCYSIYGNIKCENVTIYVNIKQMTDPWVKRQQNSIGIERVVLFVLLCPGECGLFTAWCAMICYVYMLRTIIKIIRCWEIKRKISAEFCSVINITVLSCFKSLLVDCQQIFYLRGNIWNFRVSKDRIRRLSSSRICLRGPSSERDLLTFRWNVLHPKRRCISTRPYEVTFQKVALFLNIPSTFYETYRSRINLAGCHSGEVLFLLSWIQTPWAGVYESMVPSRSGH